MIDPVQQRRLHLTPAVESGNKSIVGGCWEITRRRSDPIAKERQGSSTGKVARGLNRKEVPMYL
jgi:hypothetical protein